MASLIYSPRWYSFPFHVLKTATPYLHLPLSLTLHWQELCAVTLEEELQRKLHIAPILATGESVGTISDDYLKCRSAPVQARSQILDLSFLPARSKRERSDQLPVRFHFSRISRNDPSSWIVLMVSTTILSSLDRLTFCNHKFSIRQADWICAKRSRLTQLLEKKQGMKLSSPVLLAAACLALLAYSAHGKCLRTFPFNSRAVFCVLSRWVALRLKRWTCHTKKAPICRRPPWRLSAGQSSSFAYATASSQVDAIQSGGRQKQEFAQVGLCQGSRIVMILSSTKECASAFLILLVLLKDFQWHIEPATKRKA
jgi:hypothetical protein